MSANIFSTREESFRISAQPCNILYVRIKRGLTVFEQSFFKRIMHNDFAVKGIAKSPLNTVVRQLTSVYHTTLFYSTPEFAKFCDNVANLELLGTQYA